MRIIWRQRARTTATAAPFSSTGDGVPGAASLNPYEFAGIVEAAYRGRL